MKLRIRLPSGAGEAGTRTLRMELPGSNATLAALHAAIAQHVVEGEAAAAAERFVLSLNNKVRTASTFLVAPPSEVAVGTSSLPGCKHACWSCRMPWSATRQAPPL